MSEINIERKILSANERYALNNRRVFSEKGVYCLNLISSPGSGKTTTLVRTITELGDRLRTGVIEGDIKTDIDAKRIRETKAPAIQIETEGACHLSAAQVGETMKELPLDELDVVFIENVGNLVCPGAFDLGEDGKVVVLSVVEGDDKPVKYPGIFAKAAVLLINKIDFLSVAGFDMERVEKDVRSLNKYIRIFPISAKTGEGIAAWCDWLVEQAKQKRGS